LLFGSFLFPAAPFGLFAADFPNDATGAGFAVITGVGAGPALVQAFLTVGVAHFIATVRGLPSRMKAAFHVSLFSSLRYSIRKTWSRSCVLTVFFLQASKIYHAR
jgi:hypothetical protein